MFRSKVATVDFWARQPIVSNNFSFNSDLQDEDKFTFANFTDEQKTLSIFFYICVCGTM